MKTETDSAKLTSTSSDIRQIDLKTETGAIDIENVSRGESAEFDVTTGSGTITIDGEMIEGSSYSVRSNSEDKQFTYKIKTGSANVNYTNKAEEKPEAETESETENVGG